MITEAKVHELLSQEFEDSYKGYKGDIVKYKYSLQSQLKEGEHVDTTIDNVSFKEVERYGGTEGSGEEHWVVFSVESGGDIQYFKVPGYYQSYNGAELEFENLYEVTPGEVMVRIWNKV